MCANESPGSLRSARVNVLAMCRVSKRLEYVMCLIDAQGVRPVSPLHDRSSSESVVQRHFVPFLSLRSG